MIFGVAMLFSITQATAAEDFKFIDNPTFYIGVSGGLSTVDTGVTAVTGTASLDEDDFGAKIFVGVNINEFISVEAFYANLGEATLTANNGDTITFGGTTFAVGANNVKIAVDGVAYGIMPVFGYNVTEQFRPFAKVGIQRWDAEVTASSSAGNIVASDDGTDIMFGVGFMFAVSDSIGFRAEFERIKFDDSDADFISAGVQFTF